MNLKSIVELIPPSRRKGAWTALGSTVLSALVDLVGIAALLSVLLLVLDDNLLISSPLARKIYDAAGFRSPGLFVGAVCMSALAAVVAKSLAGIALAQYRNRYTLGLYRSLSARMYRRYLSAGLLFIRSHHTARLANNVNNVTYRFVTGIVWPVLTIASESILLLALCVLLALYDPVVLLLAALIFVPLAGVWMLRVRRRMAENGRRENRLQVAQSKLMFESLRGYADIEINAAAEYMGRLFDKGLSDLSDCRLRAERVRLWSNRIVEIALVAGVAAIILIGTAAGESPAGLRLTLGIFAVASYRIVPAVSRIAGSWLELRRSAFVVGILSDDPTAGAAGSGVPVPAVEPDLPFERNISMENVSFAYPGENGRSGPNVLENFSLRIRKGERVGIKGASGVGKTTLVNLFCGFFPPSSGRILIDGRPLDSSGLSAWRDRIALVSQDLFVPDIPLAENIAFGVDPAEIDRPRLEAAVQAACLDELTASLPDGIDSVPGEAGCRLSGGQRQRIGIARALYKRADILILDEATSSLDQRTEAAIIDAVDKIASGAQAMTMIVISHRAATLSHCDRIVELTAPAVRTDGWNQSDAHSDPEAGPLTGHPLHASLGDEAERSPDGR